MEHYVITISRKFGCLGHEIAGRLGELLGVPVYDRSAVEAQVLSTGAEARLLAATQLEEGRKIAADEVFARTVIFGLGTTGMFIGDLIRRAHPGAKIVLVARSEESSPKVRFALEQTGGVYVRSKFADNGALASAICEALGGRATLFIGTSGTNIEHEIAFEHRVLGCNGVYNSFSLGPRVSFDTMPFGFENHLIFGSINFRQDHMEEAIRILADSRYGEIVELIDKERFIADPIRAYEEDIYAKGSPLKTAVVWNDRYIDMSR